MSGNAANVSIAYKGDWMKIELNIDKKTVGIILIIAMMVVLAVAYMEGYITIGRPVYKSKREASEAITNISSGVEQIGSIIEDIDKTLGK